jgi:hypothetical protein
MVLTGTYRIFHLTAAQYTFFLEAHGTFSEKSHILGHKTSLSKKIDITTCILSDLNAIELELNNKNRGRKYANKWRLKNTLLIHQWVIEEIREEIKRLLKVNED